VLVELVLVDENLLAALAGVYGDVETLQLLLEPPFIAVAAVSFGKGSDALDERVVDLHGILQGWLT